MSGFLDRLAARAVGDAPLVHPRVRARFEPDAGALPAAPAEETAQVAEVPAAVVVEAAPRRPMEAREPVVEVRTFEPEVRSVPAERRTVAVAPAEPAEAPPSVARVPSEAPPVAEVERPVVVRVHDSEEPEDAGSRLRRDPHPLAPSPTRTHTRPGEGEPDTKAFASSPPLPDGGVREGGRGGRGVRVHRAAPPEELSAEPRRDEERLPAEPPPRLRPARVGELPTVEADRRGAPLPPSLAESEPSETVVHVSIGRIDVRATQPAAAPERRPSRPSGPRLSLGDYLKRREERRR